jgi:hypothetical protein
LSEDSENSIQWGFWGNLAAAVWMLGTTVIYFLRFTAAFYRDNQSAINALLEKLGLGFLVF